MKEVRYRTDFITIFAPRLSLLQLSVSGERKESFALARLADTEDAEAADEAEAEEEIESALEI